jgi:hypothetical protein
MIDPSDPNDPTVQGCAVLLVAAMGAIVLLVAFALALILT